MVIFSPFLNISQIYSSFPTHTNLLPFFFSPESSLYFHILLSGYPLGGLVDLPGVGLKDSGSHGLCVWIQGPSLMDLLGKNQELLPLLEELDHCGWTLGFWKSQPNTSIPLSVSCFWIKIWALSSQNQPTIQLTNHLLPSFHLKLCIRFVIQCLKAILPSEEKYLAPVTCMSPPGFGWGMKTTEKRGSCGMRWLM